MALPESVFESRSMASEALADCGEKLANDAFPDQRPAHLSISSVSATCCQV